MAQSRDGVFTWMHADHLSSATRITDVNGLEIRRLAYTSFGEAAENQGTGDEPKYTYTGKEHDATGLYYSGARCYDPVLSRFITADTVYDVGPQGLNRYSYALNNPILYRDPTGHQVEHWYQTVWVKPIETIQSTVNAGLVWVEEASGHHPLVLANTVPVKTIVDPNVETISKAVAATAKVVGIVAGGVQLARTLGVPGTQGNPIKPPKVLEGKRVLGPAENIEIEVEGNVVELRPGETLKDNTNPTQSIDIPEGSSVKIKVNKGSYFEKVDGKYISNRKTPPVIIENYGARETPSEIREIRGTK